MNIVKLSDQLTALKLTDLLHLLALCLINNEKCRLFKSGTRQQLAAEKIISYLSTLKGM